MKTTEEKYESLLSTMLTMREQLAKADEYVENLKAIIAKNHNRDVELLQRAEKAEKQYELTLAAFENMKREKHAADEHFASLKHAIQEAVSDQSDASIGQFAREIRADFALGMAAVGQMVVLKVEWERSKDFEQTCIDQNDVMQAQAREMSAAIARATDAKKAQEFAEGITEMYAKAWEREIGAPYRAKTHRIDALVLTTRDRIAERNRLRKALEEIADGAGDADVVARRALKGEA
jgi:hypothetical protein